MSEPSPTAESHHDPLDPNVSTTRRRVSPKDSIRMRELTDQLRTLLDEMGRLTSAYTDLDVDDDRTRYRFAPNESRSLDNEGIYIAIVDGWQRGVPKTACLVYCQGHGPDASYVECPCGNGSLLC